jgi:hypothetical protein
MYFVQVITTKYGVLCKNKYKHMLWFYAKQTPTYGVTCYFLSDLHQRYSFAAAMLDLLRRYLICCSSMVVAGGYYEGGSPGAAADFLFPSPPRTVG